MVKDDRELSVLAEHECLELLATVRIGRLVLTERALPAVHPVAFAVADGMIWIPTETGGRVASASHGAVVALAVDHVDAGVRTGWDVTVVGPAHVVTDDRAVARLDGLGVQPWAPGDGRCYVGVRISLVYGQRIHLARTDTVPVNADQPRPHPQPG